MIPFSLIRSGIEDGNSCHTDKAGPDGQSARASGPTDQPTAEAAHSGKQPAVASGVRSPSLPFKATASSPWRLRLLKRAPPLLVHSLACRLHLPQPLAAGCGVHGEQITSASISSVGMSQYRTLRLPVSVRPVWDMQAGCSMKRSREGVSQSVGTVPIFVRTVPHRFCRLLITFRFETPVSAT